MKEGKNLQKKKKNRANGIQASRNSGKWELGHVGIRARANSRKKFG